MSIERLIAKVAHLRALAAKAGTREEAETAARLADEIMQKHRIDAAEVEARGVAAIDDDMIEDPALYQGGRSKEAWIGNLAGTVARHYGCYVFWNRGASGLRLTIVGRKSDVEIARYMFAWCHVEITRLSLLETGKAARNGFRHGAIAGLRGALYASAKAAQVGHGSAALVLASRGRALEGVRRRNARQAPEGRTYAIRRRRRLRSRTSRGLSPERAEQTPPRGERALAREREVKALILLALVSCGSVDVAPGLFGDPSAVPPCVAFCDREERCGGAPAKCQERCEATIASRPCEGAWYACTGASACEATCEPASCADGGGT